MTRFSRSTFWAQPVGYGLETALDERERSSLSNRARLLGAPPRILWIALVVGLGTLCGLSAIWSSWMATVVALVAFVVFQALWQRHRVAVQLARQASFSWATLARVRPLKTSLSVISLVDVEWVDASMWRRSTLVVSGHVACDARSVRVLSAHDQPDFAAIIDGRVIRGRWHVSRRFTEVGAWKTTPGAKGPDRIFPWHTAGGASVFAPGHHPSCREHHSIGQGLHDGLFEGIGLVELER